VQDWFSSILGKDKSNKSLQEKKLY